MSDKEVMSSIRDWLNSRAGGPPNPPAALPEPDIAAGESVVKREEEAVQAFLASRRGAAFPAPRRSEV